MQGKGLALKAVRPDIRWMDFVEQTALLWPALAVGLVALIYALRAWMGYRQVRRDAVDDFAYKSHKGMIDPEVTQSDYVRAYIRYYGPRSIAYIAGGLTAVLVLTWPAFALINFILHQLWLMTEKSPFYEPGFFLWQFMVFFAMVGTWALIIYLTARRYHRHAPISFKRELTRQRAQDMGMI